LLKPVLSSTDQTFAPPTIDCPRGKPVFFGHYWWEENHGSNVGEDWACLDLSVANGGALACYRWHEGDQGQPLSSSRIVKVPASST
jgi:hypothetical protein